LLKLTLRQLTGHLRDALAPVYLVAGDEPLLVAEAAAEIVARARAQGFAQRDLHVVDRSFKWSELEADLGNLSLFATRRILEVRLPTGRPGEAGGRLIASFAERADPDQLLLLVSSRLESAVARAAWVKSVETLGVFVQIWPLERAELPGWLRARAQQLGLELTQPAAELLADRVEGNLLAAAQELEKLSLVRGAGRIDEAVVTDAVAESARFDVFRLTDAILAGDAPRALHVLAGLRAEGTELVLISWALAREFGLLARLKFMGRDSAALDAALQRQGVWPRRRPLIKRALSRLSSPQLSALLVQAGELDRVAKGAAASARPWDLLTRIVLAGVLPAQGLRGTAARARSAAVH
jgi:DNA polymerase-3 subunit delta